MVSDISCIRFQCLAIRSVLILVVMEYGLRPILSWRIAKKSLVLILVVMEYGLRRCKQPSEREINREVLILVVMEYGLRPLLKHILTIRDTVLILVVMEYGLRRLSHEVAGQKAASLNPCCNGIWSQTGFMPVQKKHLIYSLNPCCNGIWSQTKVSVITIARRMCVLILVVMEYGLRRVYSAAIAKK